MGVTANELTIRRFHSFLDQQLNDSEYAEVEDYLDSHLEKVDELHHYQLINERLHEIFDEILDEDIPGHLNIQKINKATESKRSADIGVDASTLEILSGGGDSDAKALKAGALALLSSDEAQTLAQVSQSFDNDFDSDSKFKLDDYYRWMGKFSDFGSGVFNQLKTAIRKPQQDDADLSLVSGDLTAEDIEKIKASTSASLYTRFDAEDQDDELESALDKPSKTEFSTLSDSSMENNSGFGTDTGLFQTDDDALLDISELDFTFDEPEPNETQKSQRAKPLSTPQAESGVADTIFSAGVAATPAETDVPDEGADDLSLDLPKVPYTKHDVQIKNPFDSNNSFNEALKSLESFDQQESDDDLDSIRSLDVMDAMEIESPTISDDPQSIDALTSSISSKIEPVSGSANSVGITSSATARPKAASSDTSFPKPRSRSSMDPPVLENPQQEAKPKQIISGESLRMKMQAALDKDKEDNDTELNASRWKTQDAAIAWLSVGVVIGWFLHAWLV